MEADLNEADDAASVRALSVRARRAPVKPAAVCIWPRWISVAAEALGNDALVYLTLFEQRFGLGSASAGNFRIGASALFDELLDAAAHG